MIQLTRLNYQALIVNCDLIKFVETAPDTVLTLVTGEKIVVRESPDEVLSSIIRYRRLVLDRDVPRRREERNRGWELKAERAGPSVQKFAEGIGRER